MSSNSHSNGVKRFFINHSRNLKSLGTRLPGLSNRAKTAFSLAALISLFLPAAVLSMSGDISESDASNSEKSTTKIKTNSQNSTHITVGSDKSNDGSETNKNGSESVKKKLGANPSIEVEVNGQSISLPEDAGDTIIKEKIQTDDGQADVYIRSSQNSSNSSEDGRNRTRVKIDSDIDSDSSFESETRVRIRERN